MWINLLILASDRALQRSEPFKAIVISLDPHKNLSIQGCLGDCLQLRA